MQGIGPGTILSGRYTAEHRTAAYPGAEQWTARDATLDRSVLLLAVRREHPNVDAVLDAARRSAGLDNMRLSRILDVGTDGDVAYVVEEALEGSQTMSELLAVSPLPAPEVRRVVGETSLVLDMARHRGLHHQRLAPDLVLRTPDGDIKVRGLATMAALAGVDDVPDQEAARTDALAVVALTYAGFTATWPLPGPSGGLPPAPRVANHVAAPSELASGVPADLDALCRLTFASNQGPTTPGDFARQIAPWSPIPVMLPTISPKSSPTSPRHESPLEDEPSAPSSREAVEASAAGRVDRPHEPVEGPAAARDGERHPDQRPDQRPQALPASQRTDQRPDQRPDRPDQRSDERPDQRPGPREKPAVKGPVPVAHRIPSPADAGPRGRHPGQAAPGTRPQAPGARPLPPGSRPMRPMRPGTRPMPPVARPPDAGGSEPAEPLGPVAPGSSLGPSPMATTAAKTAAALGAAGAATASAARSLSDRFSGWTAETRDKARLRVEDLKERREEAAAHRAAQAREHELEAEPYDYEDDAYAYMGVETADIGREGAARGRGGDYDDRLEPPIPLLPPSAADPLTRDQSRLAIGIIVGFLVIALAFAIWGLSKLPSSLPGLSSSDGSTSISTPEPEDEAGEDTSGEDTSGEAADADVTPEAPAAGQPLQFTAAADYDPLGDGTERPEDLALILDGDASTAWMSQGYRNSAFSNLKEGLGVILGLGAESSLSAVDLVLPLAVSGEVYVTSDEAFFANKPALPEEMSPAGTFSGEGSVTVELADGTRGRYVVVWFTELARDGDWYRARLAGAGATS